MRRGLHAFALSSLLASGCAAFAGKQDYADYRAIRMAPHEEARLLAMQRYVSAHPDGRWADDIQAQRKARDLAVFEASKSSRAGLELYISAFPDGQFIEQARTRLQAIAVIEARKREEAQRATALAEQRKKRDQELRRTWVTRFVDYWLRTLLSLSGWGDPIAELAKQNPAFSTAFGRPPRPRCTREECVKYYRSNYAVPIPGGTRVERSMRLILRLSMREGRVQRAELLLPAWGFSRWQEVEQREVVVDADPEDRGEAVQWALSRITPLLDELAAERVPLDGYELAKIAAPAIDESGELTDTSVEDPSAPANRIQGSASGQPVEPEPSVEALVAPEAPEPDADMVMAPITVDKQGRLAGTGDEPMQMQPMAVPEEGHSGEVMVMDPLAVGQSGQSAQADGAAASGQPGSEVALQVVPPLVRAFQAGDLRLVVFTAGSSASAPAYDGLLIEHVPQAKNKGKRKARRSRQKTPKTP